MDIYGYPTYQYNQSDEHITYTTTLPRQMYTHHPFPSIQYNRGLSDPHIMPAPSGAPWNIQGLPWGMQSPPHLVQFTAQSQAEPSLGESNQTLLHCKRKNDDIEPIIPAKQLITEEKMAAHLNSLHISSEFKNHSLASEETMDVGMEPALNGSEKLKGHRIVLSQEIKKIQDEPLLPLSIIERLEKPCMSLMVWKPKNNLEMKLEEEIKNEEEQVNKRRNGVLVVENTMDVEM